MAERRNTQPSRSERRDAFRRIVHGTFIREGMMIAFPLCFPGVTTPVPLDESHIAALDVTSDGHVYGATQGRAVHLFVGMMRGATGAVVDLGTIEDAGDVVGLCCHDTHVTVAVNTDRGGCLVTREFQGLPFDLLQEWSFPPKPMTVHDPVAGGEAVVGIARDEARATCIGVTSGHLFSFDPVTGEHSIKTELSGSGMPVFIGNRAYGHAGNGMLWMYDPASDELHRESIRLPPGRWADGAPHWATNGATETRYVSDAEGRLWQFLAQSEAFEAIGALPRTPAGPMAVTHDGRLYGCCGEGIARFFVYEPGGEVHELGAAVSTIERRRYGYRFAAAAVGHDGRIYFGEDDNLGHLWIYQPAVRR